MYKNRKAKMRLLRDIAPMMYYMTPHKNMLQNEQQIISYENRKRNFVL